jgi:hypothetical protein
MTILSKSSGRSLATEQGETLVRYHTHEGREGSGQPLPDEPGQTRETSSMTTSLRIETGVLSTAAAHITIGDSLVTAVWSTMPFACIDWLLGDTASKGPVHYTADRAPIVYRRSCGWLPGPGPHWEVVTAHRCERCTEMIGPPALAEPGHLTGRKLIDLAREVAELANDERESQRRKLIAHLAGDAERLARSMADHILRMQYTN